jgi:hypothetical protein
MDVVKENRVVMGTEVESSAKAKGSHRNDMNKQLGIWFSDGRWALKSFS